MQTNNITFVDWFMAVVVAWKADKPDYNEHKEQVISWLERNQEVWLNKVDPEIALRALNQAYAYSKQLQKRAAITV